MNFIKRIKSFFALVLVFSVVFANTALAYDEKSLSGSAQTACGYMEEILSSRETYAGSEWAVFALISNNSNKYKAYGDKYKKDIYARLNETGGELSKSKYTEYSKVIILLSAMGEDSLNVNGYNLVEKLNDFGKVTAQGVNGGIFALIALDVSGAAGYDGLKDKYIDFILGKQNADGGFSLSGESLPDITAMAAYSLAGYASRKDVKGALDKMITYLSSAQNQLGGYTAGGITSSEYTSQVIMALCEIGISVEDERFVKNGKSLIDDLMSYYEDGGFSHIKSQGKNPMATEQALYALGNVFRVERGNKGIFSSLSKESIPTEKVGFKDISSSENKDAILSLAGKGILGGKGDGIFDPSGNLTRAEFATLIVKALNLEIKGNGVFKDVKKGSWYEGFVNTAYANGIISGVSADEFCPEKNITIEEAMAMIVRSGKILNPDLKLSSNRRVLGKFSDGNEVSAWAESYVIYCIENGIFWKTSGKINHKEYIKRDKTAQLVYNFLKSQNKI